MHKSAFCLIALACAIHAPAQEFNLGEARVPIAELHGLARFHAGDDANGKLGWAEPGFDDSRWALARLDEPWSTQGFHSDSGMAWYRFRIVVAAGHPPLGIYTRGRFLDSYEIFMDGKLVARYGGLPPDEKVLQSFDNVSPVHRIPDELIPAGKPVEVALRVWHWPYWTFTPPGPPRPIAVGDAELVERQRELRVSDNLQLVSGWSFLSIACLLGFCAGLGLFRLRPGESEYVWFAGSEFGFAGFAYWNSYPAAHAAEFHGYMTWMALSLLIINTCWPTFLVTFLREPRRRLYWVTIATGLVVPITFLPFLFQWISAGRFILLGYLATIPALAGAFLLIWIPARRGGLDARLLLAPQLLLMGAKISQGAIFFSQAAGHYAFASYWQNRFDLALTWPFNFSIESLVDFIVQAAVLAILVLRFARKSRDEERMKSEFEAARLVQLVLVPAAPPEVPGVRIASTYRPAGEVGGDFYQVIPTSSGGALLVIGDVSGKGMPAAMTVSLLVGTFRTLAHYTQSPSEILRAMNQRMLSRSDGGFTTCLVLRADPDGRLTLANAGHLPPYVDGREIPMDSSLPLGISADSDYPEIALDLPPDSQLTMMTDGVVEARNKAGELFGFERTAELSSEPAEKVAQTAQAFGQEDDITVLTLTFATAGALDG